LTSPLYTETSLTQVVTYDESTDLEAVLLTNNNDNHGSNIK